MGGGDDSCPSRAVKAGLAGAAAGAAVGAASATWSAEAPVVVGGRAMPALLRTGKGGEALGCPPTLSRERGWGQGHASVCSLSRAHRAAPLILSSSLPFPSPGRVMGATAASFGLVGAVFAGVDCAVEGLRGE